MNEDFGTKLKNVQEWLSNEYAGIRTGQAAPGLLDGIKVEQYGVMTPLQQVGSVGVEDARTLRISTWDASVIPAVEKAIAEADLGVSVATDSAGLRVIFPELTAERREQLIKLAKAKLEESRVSVRSARDEAVKAIEAAQKAGDISEDEKFTQKEDIQKAVDATNKQLEEIYQQKESGLQI